MSIFKDERPDVKSLEAFAAVVSCGSMTAAAQMLSISQPAVTRMVRDLEERVGFDLFKRNGPRISPTEKGLKFYEESRRVIANLSHLTSRAQAIRDGRIGAIEIVATPTMAAGLVPCVLSRLAQNLPDLVQLETVNAERVVHALRNRTADLGFSAFPVAHEKLDCLAQYESSLVAMVEKGGEFDRPGPIPLSVFKTVRLATVGNTLRVRHEIDGVFKKQGIAPASEIVTNSSLNAAMVARSGLGIAICDPVTAFGVPIDGISVRPMATPIKYAWGLFAGEDTQFEDDLTPVVDAFGAESALIVQRVEALD